VVEFIDIHYCCGYNTPHTFEVTLYPNGDILSQYQSLNDTSTDYVGIENIDGTDGLGYGYSLADNLAIRYTFPVGVFLTPADQSGFGEPSTTVPYTLLVQNLTGSTDSSDLSLEPEACDHTLSITRRACLRMERASPSTCG
jgi:hypothetical protein